MIYGIYQSALGANVQSLRHDVLANNLANSSTTAFKRDLPIVEGHAAFDLRKGIGSADPHQGNFRGGEWNLQTGGVSVDRIVTDHRTASLNETKRPYDIALQGEGFLKVRTNDDSPEFLTRNGRLARENGVLVTEDQRMEVVSTANSPIAIPDNVERLEISADGDVWGHSGPAKVLLGRLERVTTDLDQIQKVGGSLYVANAPLEPATDVKFRQGFVEASGVEPIHEMVNMIDASRAFEMNVNMIRMQDESLAQLLKFAGG